jgi:hypothetical protein
MVAALLTFPRCISCKGEVLGSKTPIALGNLTGLLAMPLLPAWSATEDDPLHMPLRPPSDEWFRVSHEWGTPISYPDGCTVVRQAAVEFHGGIEIVNQQSAEIIEALTSWVRKFSDYAELITRDYRTGVVVSQDGEVPVQVRLLDRSAGEVRTLARQRDPCLSIHTALDSWGLSLEQFSQAAELASLNAETKLQYKMLLRAFRATRECDWRSAVVEGACAVEASLADRAQSELRAAGRESISLMKDFRGLTRLVSLARVLGIHLPDVDLKTDVIQLRNDVVHRGISPQRSDALKLLQTAERVISNVTPEMCAPPQHLG